MMACPVATTRHSLAEPLRHATIGDQSYSGDTYYGDTSSSRLVSRPFDILKRLSYPVLPWVPRWDAQDQLVV